ncbi:MAG: extensin family protein, partial [Candidatus Marinimicrobia bacterium]|nr:extensin family protein [Candidatus Neomarinimicrobiota bacterium]
RSAEIKYGADGMEDMPLDFTGAAWPENPALPYASTGTGQDTGGEVPSETLIEQHMLEMHENPGAWTDAGYPVFGNSQSNVYWERLRRNAMGYLETQGYNTSGTTTVDTLDLDQLPTAADYANLGLGHLLPIDEYQAEFNVLSELTEEQYPEFMDYIGAEYGEPEAGEALSLGDLEEIGTFAADLPPGSLQLMYDLEMLNEDIMPEAGYFLGTSEEIQGLISGAQSPEEVEQALMQSLEDLAYSTAISPDTVGDPEAQRQQFALDLYQNRQLSNEMVEYALGAFDQVVQNAGIEPPPEEGLSNYRTSPVDTPTYPTGLGIDTLSFDQYEDRYFTQLPGNLAGVNVSGPNMRVHSGLIQPLTDIMGALRGAGVTDVGGMDGQVSYINGQPRYIAGTDTLSSHFFGLGIDIYDFTLIDGTKVSVTDWNDPQKGPIIQNIYNAIAESMPPGSSLLGPDYNAAHANHFHYNIGYTQQGHVKAGGDEPTMGTVDQGQFLTALPRIGTGLDREDQIVPLPGRTAEQTRQQALQQIITSGAEGSMTAERAEYLQGVVADLRGKLLSGGSPVSIVEYLKGFANMTDESGAPLLTETEVIAILTELESIMDL